MTSIAALQCVERGLFELDEDVTRLLPEFRDVEILKGFEEGTEKPILVKATKKITLKWVFPIAPHFELSHAVQFSGLVALSHLTNLVRHLLTHSSGLAYDIFNPLLQQWRKSRGEKSHFTNGSLAHRYLVPLLFEPGELWEYSRKPKTLSLDSTWSS